MKTVAIDLDKKRHLYFNNFYLCKIENYFDKGIGELFSQKRVGLEVVNVCVWAGLLWEDRGLTFERACGFIDKYYENGGDTESLTVKVMEAMQASGCFKQEKNPEKVEESDRPLDQSGQVVPYSVSGNGF